MESQRSLVLRESMGPAAADPGLQHCVCRVDDYEQLLADRAEPLFSLTNVRVFFFLQPNINLLEYRFSAVHVEFFWRSASSRAEVHVALDDAPFFEICSEAFLCDVGTLFRSEEVRAGTRRSSSLRCWARRWCRRKRPQLSWCPLACSRRGEAQHDRKRQVAAA